MDLFCQGRLPACRRGLANVARRCLPGLVCGKPRPPRSGPV